MTFDPDSYFRLRGHGAPPFEPATGCPSEEAMAGWLDGVLLPPDGTAFEDHVLGCRDCSVVLRAAVDVRVRPAPFRVLVRLLDRGLELINRFELTFPAPLPEPALGALRRAKAVPPELVSICGPGGGIDELQIQVLSDGTARLVVTCHSTPTLHSGEAACFVFEVDGSTREKRPFTGKPVAFAPIQPGHCAIRLVARRPGQPARVLSEAQVDLSR